MSDLVQCRLCANFSKFDKMLHIKQKESAELNLEHKIQECLDINFNDLLLPQYVCLSCSNKVSSSFEFQELVKKAQLLFLKPVIKKEIELIDIADSELPDTNPKFEFKNESYNNKDESDILTNLLLVDDIKFKEEEIEEFNINPETNRSDPLNPTNRDSITLRELLSTKQNIESVKKHSGNLLLSMLTDLKPNQMVIVEPKVQQNNALHEEENNEIGDVEIDSNNIDDENEISRTVSRTRKEWRNYKWKCTICNEIQSSVEKLETHFADVHQKAPQYACVTCSKVFNTLKYLKCHVRQHQLLKQFNYRCPVCSKLFALKKYYQNHINKHQSEMNDVRIEKQYSCLVCNKNFTSILDLRTHSVNYHITGKQFKCEICNKLVNTKQSFDLHIKWHRGEQNFACEQCGKKFLHQGSFTYHQKTAHSDARPHCCPICSVRFKVKYSLERHLKFHSDNKPHLCGTCGKSFKRKGTLREHLKVHSDLAEYECTFCKKRFKNGYRLKVHLRQHTGEKPYACTHCDRLFTNSSNYRKHVKVKHDILVPNKDALREEKSSDIL